MIGMSRSVPLLAVLGALGAFGCDHSCGAVGCNNGLSLSFAGFTPGSTYQIVVSVVTPMEVIPFVTCTAAPDDLGAEQLSCASDQLHAESGTTLRIPDDTLKQLQVNVSSNGTHFVQQTFAVTFESKEINGPGCGVCTSADITMTIP